MLKGNVETVPRADQYVSAMKTAKGKDKANTTKEALKPRKVGKGKAPAEKHIPFTGLMVFIREFQEPNPDLWSSSGGIQAKAQRWKSMSHTEKAPYEEKAAKLEAKHEKLFGAHNKNMDEDFVAGEDDDGGSPTDDSGEDDSDASDGGGGEKEKSKEPKKEASSRKQKKKREKDPVAPKMGLPSFMHFCKMHRKHVMVTRPGISSQGLGKVLIDAWRGLSAEEKEPYEDMARDDNKRYQDEIRDYENPQPMLVDSGDDSDSH